MPTPHTRRTPSLRRALLGAALIAGLLVGLIRAALWVRSDGYLAGGLHGVAARTFLVDLASGAVLMAMLALVVALLLTRDSRWLRGGASVAGIALVMLVATDRLPDASRATPALGTGSGLLAHAAVFVLALVVVGALRELPRWVKREGRVAPWLGSRWIPLGMLAVLGSGMAARLAPVRPGIARPSVVLISLDTLRQDRLGCYGYSRDTTPNLDRFAAGAVRFDNAYCNFPRTLFSHATMFTGLHRSVHGVDASQPIHPSLTPLARSFREAGYVTAGFVDGCPWMSERFGYADGFHVYRQVYGSIEDKNRQVEAFLDDVGDQPLFLFLHFFDVHNDTLEAYEAPAPFAGLYSGWYDGDLRGAPMDEWRARVASADLGEPERRYLSDLYDEGVQYTDHFLGETLAMLERRDPERQGPILITSDHGEELLDHGRCGHSQFYDECMRTVLLLGLPGAERGGQSIDDPVCLVDLAPTLAELGGVPMQHPVQGRSLLALMRGDLPPGPHPIIADHGDDQLSVRLGRWKLLRRADGFELYDLQEDPGERHDLWGQDPELERRLLRLVDEQAARNRRLRESLGPRSGRGGVVMSRDEEELLRALGYADE